MFMSALTIRSSLSGVTSYMKVLLFHFEQKAMASIRLSNTKSASFLDKRFSGRHVSNKPSTACLSSCARSWVALMGIMQSPYLKLLSSTR